MKQLPMILVFALGLYSCDSSNPAATPEKKLNRLSGNVYSLGLDSSKTPKPGVKLLLEGDRTDSATSDASGNFSFMVDTGNFWVTPSFPNTTFDSMNIYARVTTTDVGGIDFQAMPMLLMAGRPTTSTAPKKFKAGRLNYGTNAAFWEFKDQVSESRAITIPGLVKTVTPSHISTDMVPQGFCFAKDYILISAYDFPKNMNSVIYVLSKADKTLKTVLYLPTNGHVGGLAYDSVNVWVCDGKTMGVLKYAMIDSLVADGGKSYDIDSFVRSVPVSTTASFATFYQNRLFVGQFNETSTDDMYGYDIRSKTTDSVSLSKAIKMEVPEKTQGVAFDTDGLMIASTSYGRNIYATLRFYKPDWSNIDSAKGNFVYKRDAVKTLTIPPMSEGVSIDGGYTYVLFESGASEYSDGASYCIYAMNRILPFKTSGIVK